MLRCQISFVILLGVWCVTFQKCQHGKSQSPIDIVSADARVQKYPPLSLFGYSDLSIRRGSLTATNNKGETLKLIAREDKEPALLSGGPLNVEFQFLEMHFHWGNIINGLPSSKGSEHSIDGKNYPAELHMVHRNIHDNTTEEALEHPNGLTVLGFKFEIVKRKKSPPGMDLLARIARNRLEKPDSMFGKNDLEKENAAGDVEVRNFIPVSLKDYFHYKGSLTTGNCDEAVNWIVFKKPLAITEDLFRAFQSLKTKTGENIINNFRQKQPVNDRPVYFNGFSLTDFEYTILQNSQGLPSCQLSPLSAILANKVDQKKAKKIWRKECKKRMRMQYLYNLQRRCLTRSKPRRYLDTYSNDIVIME